LQLHCFLPAPAKLAALLRSNEDFRASKLRKWKGYEKPHAGAARYEDVKVGGEICIGRQEMPHQMRESTLPALAPTNASLSGPRAGSAQHWEPQPASSGLTSCTADRKAPALRRQRAPNQGSPRLTGPTLAPPEPSTLAVADMMRTTEPIALPSVATTFHASAVHVPY
jgi:hypothetical protein